MAGVALLAVLLLVASSTSAAGSTDVLRQNVSLNVDLTGVRLLPDDGRRRRLVVVRRRRRKDEDDDRRVHGIASSDDYTSWETVANDKFVRGNLLDSLASLPFEDDVMSPDGSFDSSEHLDRHLSFLRKRRQGPNLAGPPWLLGPPAGPGDILDYRSSTHFITATHRSPSVISFQPLIR
ncbi:hypothetical protein HPB50_025515 [Hyalomma asiaticum]|uniref:Uncharacterized protein n=1 Tax=Hyalomma asiaticum TaxID=266040 RepID=A0ACB7ST32_HYAAI|nr:hypothetical protein HPB50_025515 [Hyalomma asiaticum]